MISYEKYVHLKIDIEDGIGLVTLNRPEARNAMNRAMIHDLYDIWVDLARDDRIRSVIVTGASSWFSVGGDVKAMSGRAGGDFLDEGEAWDPATSRRMIDNLLDLDKPVICAINGDAIGLAATLALFCDLSVMAEDARIGDPHVRVGLVAGDGGAVIWPLLLGMSRAKEYLLRGMLLTGVKAEQLGMVNYSVVKEDVMPKALEIARELAAGAPWAIRWTKLSLNLRLRDHVNRVQPAAYALEHVTMGMADHKEAATAFKEKRVPAFIGR